MDSRQPDKATDEIIGIAFKRTLVFVALVAALVGATLLVSRLSQEPGEPGRHLGDRPR